MKIGVLTSSRADYGIYAPLLSKLNSEPKFDLEIVAFGTHLSHKHGFTLTNIQNDGFKKIHTLETVSPKDDASGIASSYALTVTKFAEFWSSHRFDLVFCLGDRYEMSAAVQAGIPFQIKFAHLHGGETTLGAFDNIYRHQITLASDLHFVAAEDFAKRVDALLPGAKVYNVGSLSLDGIDQTEFVDEDFFRNKFCIPSVDFALLTFHPETMVDEQETYRMATELSRALDKLAQQIHLVVTMPNADTLGSVFRTAIHTAQGKNIEKLTIVENFGKQFYFTAMNYAKVLIGNTSSGIIEAASFGKYVVNVGNRQKGRLASPNVFHCTFHADEICAYAQQALQLDTYQGPNLYYKTGAADAIIRIIKDEYDKF